MAVAARPELRFGTANARPLLFLVAVLLVWDVVTRAGIVQDFLLPSPWAVLSELGRLLGELVTGGPVLRHFLVTLNEIVLGFVLAVVIGVVVGATMSESAIVARAVYPLVVGIDSTPKIAIAPLLVIWFGFGQLSKVVMVMSIAVFPIIINTRAGLEATDAGTLRLMKSLGSTRWETFRKVRLHFALPLFFAGLEIAMTGAAIGAIVAEFSGGNEGLGYLTLRAQEAFQLAEGLAIVVLLALQGILLHRLVIFARRRAVFWSNQERMR